MNVLDRKNLLDALVQNYLSEKENNQVWKREGSSGYSIALGKLIGACTALNLDIEETDKELTISTRKSKRTVIKWEK